jgi:pseudouridine synthase
VSQNDRSGRAGRSGRRASRPRPGGARASGDSSAGRTRRTDGERPERPERGGGAGRPQRPDRPERPKRLEGGARAAQATSGARGARPARGERPERPGRVVRPQQPERSDRHERPDRPEAATQNGAETEGLRINKALSAAGLGSRRAVEELVKAGRVAINGEVLREMGRRVDPASDRVEVDGSRVVLDQRLRYWMLNKPLGVVSTADDPQGRPTVVEMVPEEPRVYPVGRLDRDSEGLVLLTNDGELANRVTHPRYGVQKRYLAEVERLPASAVARVQQGVELDDGLARAERARVVAGSGRRRMMEVVMVEGRKREVRRMLEAVGAPVRRLVRTAIGPLRLTGLAPGEYRALRPEEVRSLYRAVGL